MNFLETVGLLTVIFVGFILLGELLQKIKENDRKLEEDRIAGEKALAKYREEQEKKIEQEKEKELLAKAILEKQYNYKKKWENVDPEEEYLIRIGNIKCDFFDSDVYKGYGISPWGSSVDFEEREFKKQQHLLIKVDDIIKNYGIPIQALEMLYKSYTNEYYNDNVEFTDDDKNVVNFHRNWFPEKLLKSNIHQITLNKIIRTLEKLNEIGIAKNITPIYRRE